MSSYRDSERAHGFTQIPAATGGTRSCDLSGLECGRRHSSVLFGDQCFQNVLTQKGPGHSPGHSSSSSYP